MTEKSYLQTMFDAWGDMNSVFTYFRRQLNEECTAFLTKWTANPPVGLPDQTDLWSEENVEFMAQTGMIFLSRKERFYYIATGLLNGGDGEHDWIFIPMLHDERHIEINIMIACPAMDNVQNIEAMRSAFHYPKVRADFIALARIFHWWGLLLVVGLGLWVVVWWGWLGPGRGVRPGAPFGGWWLF